MKEKIENIRQGPTVKVMEMIGVADSDGDLCFVSDFDRRVDAGILDGPVLWDDLEEAQEAVKLMGAMSDGDKFVSVTITIKSLDS